MSGGVTAGINMSDKQNPARAVPVRVKKKTLKKLSNAERLEIENAKMEERLRTLRKTIEQQKQVRSAQPDYVWKSGQRGAVTTHAKEHSSKNKHAGTKIGEKKIKVKFLTPVSEKGESRERRAAPRVSTPHNSSFNSGTSWAQPQTTPRQLGSRGSDCSEEARADVPHAEAQRLPHAEAQRLPRESVAWSAESGEMEGLQRQASIVGPVCGQCELNGAQLNCMECGEKYCSDCFAIFHKKGALKSHTSRPLTRQSLNLNCGSSRHINVDEAIAEDSLWGEYDEAASAQSFLDAVKAWRGEEVTTDHVGAQPANGAKKTTDAVQTAKNAIQDINFSENENVSYFERMLLKRQKDKAISEDDVNSENSAGEITVSQLDFCKDLLAHNIEEDRKSRMESERPESVIEIVEVNSNIGYLEEEASCVIEESVDSSDEDEIRAQMALGRSLLSSVKIEEYSPRGTTDYPSTAGIFQQNGSILIEPVEDETPTTNLSEQSIRQSLTSHSRNLPAVTTPREKSNTPRADQVPRASTPPRTTTGPQGRTSGAGFPRQQERAYTPPRIDKKNTPLSVRSSVNRVGRSYTESTRSPLLRRIPTNPEISRGAEKVSSDGGRELKRPLTADVVILSSQAWKQSFIGFVQAGLPGYTLPSTPPTPTRKEKEEKEEEIMLRGPPSWCPGESQVHNEIFQSRENTISFSLAESENSYPQGTPPATAGNPDNRDLKSAGSDVVQCQDLNLNSDLEYESETVLAALGKELDVSKSRDLGDYLTTLRNATPDPVTLLTHQDRMSQLDLESRGMTPTATPLITPRITTRESLFLDFEDVEKQIMAGEENVQ